MEKIFGSEFYKDIINKENMNIWISDLETDEIVFVNDYMRRNLNLVEPEGKKCWEALQKGMTGRCEFCKIGQLEKGGEVCEWRETNTCNGRIYKNFDRIEEWNGRLYHVQEAFDITEQLQLSREATIDELTGILNRQAGKKLLEEALNSLKDEESISVTLYDINGLKWVNDTYGHLEGDRLLGFVARNIQTELTGRDFVFRLSGDEFIIVFYDKTMQEMESWMRQMLVILEERRIAHGMNYEVSFSYGFARVHGGERLTISDVLSIADSQMYIQKREHHIVLGKKKLHENPEDNRSKIAFQYNKEHLFEALSESMEDYAFVGNLKTGRFMYSQKMKEDFGLPSTVLSNAAAFWSEIIHPNDAMHFLRSNQEIADGRAERHTILYRAKNVKGEWNHLLCKGRMVRDEDGQPDLFAGVIRNIDRTGANQQVMELVQDSQGKTSWTLADEKREELALLDFKEKTMREMLEKDYVFSFRLNVTTDRLEDMWNCKCLKNGIFAKQPETVGYEEIYDFICGLIVNEDERMRFQEGYTLDRIRQRVEADELIDEMEFRGCDEAGQIIWISLNMGMALLPENGERMLFIYAKNIDRIKKRELSLRRKAEIDEVTGFYNYNTAKLLIDDILSKNQERKEGCALLLLDVNSFKEVNRIGGFCAGDELMRQMSRIMQDFVPETSIVGRMSGDILIIFYYGMQSSKEIGQLAENLRSALCRTYNVNQMEMEIEVSAGIVYQFAEMMSYDQMYQCALYALDAVKKNRQEPMLSYQDVENLDSGMEIEVEVDVASGRVLCMNRMGELAFGRKIEPDSEVKCYELLHGNQARCEFCPRTPEVDKYYNWECYVAPLGRTVYVNEKKTLRNGRMVQKIQMRELPFRKERDNLGEGYTLMLEHLWQNVEMDESPQQIFQKFAEYAGRYYWAHRVRILVKRSRISRMKEEIVWCFNGIDALEETKTPDWEEVETFLRTLRYYKLLRIEDASSEGYAELKACYGDCELPLPMIVGGIFEKEELIGGILLENVERNIEEFATVKAVKETLRRFLYLFRLRQRYQEALTYDQGTGLLNYESYKKLVENTSEDVLSSLGMAAVHIVDLKNYNYSYGIAKGDELLRYVARMLKKYFGDTCYRISGAGCMAVCPDMLYESFNQRYEEFCLNLEKRYPNQCVCVKVWEENIIDVQRMQEQVEEKIEVAVRYRRNRLVYNEKQSIDEILDTLGNSIGKGKLQVFLQPKADTRTKKICGAEALVRFYHQKKGVIPPAQFLPGLERAGLIRHVDLFVLKEVCRMLGEWKQKGFGTFPVSVNFSRLTMLEPGILEETEQIVRDAGVSKELIEIEVTESIGKTDSAGLKEIVTEFKQAGFRIALDDFGAEYSNIYVMYAMDMDCLKLDRRIVSDIYHDKRARLVAKSVIEVCKELGIVCVAEGVETKEQLEVLKEMGCDILQGYYFNKPLLEEEFEKQYMTETTERNVHGTFT